MTATGAPATHNYRRPSAADLDAGVLARAQAGDREAFDVLYERYEAPIFNYLVRLLFGERDAIPLAEDCAQDTFLKAYLKLPAATFTDPHDVQAWLYRIATNRAMDELRHRKVLRWLSFDGLFTVLSGVGGNAREAREQRGTAPGIRVEGWRNADAPVVADRLTDADPAANPEAALQAAQDAELVKGALAGLTPEERAALLLREYDGMDYDQIAVAVGRTRMGVKALLFRARDKLRATGRKWRELQAAAEAA